MRGHYAAVAWVFANHPNRIAAARYARSDRATACIVRASARGHQALPRYRTSAACDRDVISRAKRRSIRRSPIGYDSVAKIMVDHSTHKPEIATIHVR